MGMEAGGGGGRNGKAEKGGRFAIYYENFAESKNHTREVIKSLSLKSRD